MTRAALFGAVFAVAAAAQAMGAPPLAQPSADPLAAVGGVRQPPPMAAKPLFETLWGTQIADPYRFMEALGPDTIGWMKQQAAYTRAVLDGIGPLAALRERIGAFTGSFDLVQHYAAYQGRLFFQERAPGSDNYDLIVQDAKGRRKLVDVAALRAQHGGEPMAINYFLASPDGARVAVGISAGGSEEASISVIDAATGATVAGPLDRAEFGATAWTDDGRTLFFVRLKKLAAGESPIDKYFDASLVGWDLRHDPVVLLGSTAGHGPHFDKTETPGLTLTPGSPMAVAVNINGVQNEVSLWQGKAAGAADPAAVWTPLAVRADDVTEFDVHGDTIYLLSHKDAPTFQVLSVASGQSLKNARVVVAAKPDQVIDAIHAASDALYVLARSGAYSHLLRLAYGKDGAEEIPLPFKGHVDDAFTDPRAPGVAISLSSWVVPPTEFHYDPAAGSFADLKLGAAPPVDASKFVVQDLQARAADGVMVPLSLVQPRGVSGPQITIVQAYGSYGISELADFSGRSVAFLKEGGSYASCHVRGGGELGDAWRVAGKDRQKVNTWRDLIACGEDLIARGVTSREKLFILGGSAGGITMGRAMTERPDLFAGVIDLVPSANPLRAEFSPNGPDNIPEFGSVTTKDGFANLLREDSIQHVRKGVAYPAVMITTGLNDPRVSPWEPAKFAASLMASGTPNPVLLRVDAKAGHGIGSTKTQADALTADIYGFVFWRAGRVGWRPQTR